MLKNTFSPVDGSRFSSPALLYAYEIADTVETSINTRIFMDIGLKINTFSLL